jgi:signal transduction histidine kinase
MRSMFFKLFLSFWLIMILGGAASVAVVSTFQHLSIESMKGDMTRKIDENLARLIVLSGQAAWEMYRCGGREEYENYIDGLAAGSRTGISLIRDDNSTITGEKIEDDLAQLADSARKNNEVVLRKSGETLTVAKHLMAKNGSSIVAIGTHLLGPHPGGPPGGREPHFLAGPPPKMPPPPDWRGPPSSERGSLHVFTRFLPPFFGRGEIVRIATMLVVVLGVCYLLARSLTTPIRKLQKTAQQIAAGDYSARVGKSLGRTGNEIADLGRDFDIMVERTEGLIGAQKRLLRDISHELRSPLARLNVALALAKKRLNAEDDGSLRKIGQEADRINELIGHLLTLARLQSGVGVPAPEPVDLAGLLREVAGDVDFEVASKMRGVNIISSEEVTVTGSGELLRRAIENIVRNAAQYTAQNTRVEISLSVRGKEAEITVVDFGPGVPEQDLPHLFEPFYRVAKARERGTGGVGIGLAIAKQAVKAHRGRLTARNGDDRKGLIVAMTLPLQI